MQAFETFQKYYTERWNFKLLIRDRKEERGKIIGYTDVNCPEELIIAAGCQPLLLTGDPNNHREIPVKHVQYPSCLPVYYLYDAIISGAYDFVDMICITGGDKWAVSMFHNLSAEKILNQSLKFGELYFLQRLRTTFKRHRDYYRDQLVLFKQYLEKFTGNKITDSTLLEAFETTNESRRLLRRISDLRKTDPPLISGCEALPIIMSSMLIPKEEYNNLLKHFLKEEILNLPKKDTSRMRLFVSGSPIDNLRLYEIIESESALVVGEDTIFGDRFSETPINMEIDPIEALADRYIYKPLDTWMLGLKERIKYRVDSAISARAQGSILFHILYDGGPGWDYPDQKIEFEKHNIQTLLLQGQEYKIHNSEELQKLIGHFIHEIRKGNSV